VATKEFIGPNNIIAQANGAQIKIHQGEAVTFVTYLDAGTQALTLEESIDGASSQNLAEITKLYKAPGTGGTWTEVTQTASHQYTHADATNDAVVLTVFGTQLSDGYNTVELTGATGTVLAIVHGLHNERAATKLLSPV
jgi:hypothetical protein